MTAVTIRPAHEDDIDAVLAFWLVAAENEGRPADDRAPVLTLLERDPGALLLADDDHRVVGTVIAGWDGWRAHLYRLAVHPDRRRRGIAAALLARAEARLAGLGAARFDAMVLDGNDAGHRLWSHSGYRAQASWSRWIKNAADA